MSEWWDDEDEDWAERSTPSRAWVGVVAVVILVPLVVLWAGVGGALRAAGPGLVAVAAFFAVVAGAFVLTRRWLRRRVLGGGPRGRSGRV